MEELRQKQAIKKEVQKQEFLDDVNKLHNNLDSIVIPSIGIMKEYDDKFISFYIAKYPYALQYSITMYRKDYPFSIYYEKKFRSKDTITKKYIKDFEELEKYFEEK